MSDDLEKSPAVSARLWDALDTIAKRLLGIEEKLSDIVRLEERMNNHEQALSRYGNRLDKHDNRLHNVELQQAKNEDLGKRVRVLETVKNVNSGQKDVVKEVLKWVSIVLAAIVIWLLKGN